MKALIKKEFERMLHSKMLYISLAVGLSITLMHFVDKVIPRANDILGHFDGCSATYPHSVFNSWIAICGGVDVYMMAYMYLFPILAVLPYGVSFYQDMKSGYIKQLYTRISRRKVHAARYIVTFVSGGCTVIIPLIINLVLTMAVLPSLKPTFNGLFPLVTASAFGKLFYTYPYLYTILYIFIYFIFGGVFATVCLAVAYYIENVFLISLFPFVLSYALTLVSDYVVRYTEIRTIGPLYMLDMAQYRMSSELNLILVPLIIGGIAAYIFFIKGEHEDVY